MDFLVENIGHQYLLYLNMNFAKNNENKIIKRVD